MGLPLFNKVFEHNFIHKLWIGNNNSMEAFYSSIFIIIFFCVFDTHTHTHSETCACNWNRVKQSNTIIDFINKIKYSKTNIVAMYVFVCCCCERWHRKTNNRRIYLIGKFCTHAKRSKEFICWLRFTERSSLITTTMYQLAIISLIT